MSQLVSVRREGRVAVLEIDNPPINALGGAVRQGLQRALREAVADGAVAAIVICGRGRLFSGGADIREFGSPPQLPGLSDLILEFEMATKPIVAALHGSVYGGGFELALGCHYRTASPTAQFGLPEVKLGLIPGAGGTQRLPRLIGPVAALKPVVTGEPIPAEQALELGIVDRITGGDLVAAAIGFAEEIADARPLPRTSQLNDLLEPVRRDGTAFEQEATRLLAPIRGLQGPQACVTSIRNALSMPFSEGQAEERRIFATLRDGEESRAQRHLFFAEREALKVPGAGKDVASRPVSSIAVIGAGMMGGGIAMALASAGFPVTLIDSNADALEHRQAAIAESYRKTAARGGFTEEEIEAALNNIVGSQRLQSSVGANLVIEAVFENMELKKAIFADLGRLSAPGTVLATNTSSLDVNEIAEASGRPQDVVGMHFFSPANVMRLLEIVRGARTAPDVIKTAIGVGRQAGKICTVVGVCFGFVGNRMLAARSRQVDAMLLEGASPAEIDAAARAFGFAMGPCAVGDLVGLDIGYSTRKAAGRTAPVADAIAEMGRYGQKTGAGYFRYQPGSRKATHDPEIDTLIERIAAEKNVKRRKLSQEEITDRLVLPLINEGARILEEGIAERASDIDLIWIHGYGFPVARGGPMYYADRVGPRHVAQRLSALAEKTGDAELVPSLLLGRMAESGNAFSHFSRSASDARS